MRDRVGEERRDEEVLILSSQSAGREREIRDSCTAPRLDPTELASFLR